MVCNYSNTIMNNLVHMYFITAGDVYLQGKNPEEGVGQRVNVYVVLLDIAKFPSMGVASFCLSSSNA